MDETDEIFAISDLITEITRLAERASDVRCSSLAVYLLAGASQVLDRERSRLVARLASIDAGSLPH